MTTFTTEDRELVEKEPIPFYGYYCPTDSSAHNDSPPLHSMSKKFKAAYQIDESSEDLEE